jgi:hypothetical protein
MDVRGGSGRDVPGCLQGPPAVKTVRIFWASEVVPQAVTLPRIHNFRGERVGPVTNGPFSMTNRGSPTNAESRFPSDSVPRVTFRANWLTDR